MKDKGHFYISLAKSLARIVGCLITLVTNNLIPLGAFFIAAELLGILEEIVDKR